MTRQSGARTPISPWLEHLAWNAAALAAVAVMLLVLLGSLEWLDHLTPTKATNTPSAPRSAHAAQRPARHPIVAVGGGRGAKRDSEGCAAPRSRSG